MTSQPPSTTPDSQITALYHGLLDAWNRRDAADFAALFDGDGVSVGFDGSQMNGRADIESTLRQIFADHQTSVYVGKIRFVRLLSPDVAMLNAVSGMVPPGGSDINPAVNTIQTLVATNHNGAWYIALFQNTPAQFHGRPEHAEALTNELRALL